VYKKKGLPASVEMRHEPHYIEELLLRKGGAVGKLIKIEQLTSNPYQPRKDFGNIDELAQSIKEKGVIEPLIVRPYGDKYQIVCGERRYRASVLAGLKEVPCIEKELTDKEMLEIALIENLHRKDLDCFEEAEALKKLAAEFNYTHNQIAQIIGKSRSYITELMSIASIPEDIKEFCRQADIKSATVLIELARVDNYEKMWDFAKRIAKKEIKRQQIRDEKKNVYYPELVKNFKYSDPNGEYKLNIKFFGQEANKYNILLALKKVIHYIEENF